LDQNPGLDALASLAWSVVGWGSESLFLKAMNPL
jgi:hypothetical protein